MGEEILLGCTLCDKRLEKLKPAAIDCKGMRRIREWIRRRKEVVDVSGQKEKRRQRGVRR